MMQTLHWMQVMQVMQVMQMAWRCCLVSGGARYLAASRAV
jgi:hypothetical protein